MSTFTIMLYTVHVIVFGCVSILVLLDVNYDTDIFDRSDFIKLLSGLAAGGLAYANAVFLFP